MTQNLAAASVATLVFVVVLSLAAIAMRAGVLPGDAMRLWAGAIVAGGGGVPIGRIVAAYPTLPFLATTVLSLVLPDGAPALALLAAALVSLVGGLWFASFLRAGMVPLAAFVTALLLALHPAILRAALGGPADVFLALFLYALAVALYDLRARAATPDVMAVGLALLALTFSHPLGAAVAFTAAPFLVFAVRPALIANSAVNVVLALIFPTAFAIGAFAYVSWIFPGAGWTFFAAPAESLATWSAGFAHVFGNGVTSFLSLDSSLAILLALALGAPLAVFGLFAMRHRRALVVPALVFVATIIAAASMAVATGLLGDPTGLVTVARTALGGAARVRACARRFRLARRSGGTRRHRFRDGRAAPRRSFRRRPRTQRDARGRRRDIRAQWCARRHRERPGDRDWPSLRSRLARSFAGGIHAGAAVPASSGPVRRCPRSAQRDRGGRSPEPRLSGSISPWRAGLSPDLPQQHLESVRE